MKASFSVVLKHLLVRKPKPSPSSATQGFTLLELLIATAIAGGIITGLTYIVIQLLGADQLEAARIENQREIQTAMDYIANEVRESVYVYEGACLGTAARGTASDPASNFCPGLLNHLPVALGQSGRSVPVIAFWKQQPIPRALHTACSSNTPPDTVPCLNAHSPALVVYSLSKDNPSNIWRGRARITRYVLSQFNASGVATPGYVDPAVYDNYTSWPYGQSGEPTEPGIINLQRGTRPTGSAVPLVDFVDDGSGATALGLNRGAASSCPDNPATAEVEYSMSPSNTTLSSLGFSGVRSFYACVSTDFQIGQDVLLYLQGNPFGRPGITRDNGVPPILETRVLVRGLRRWNPPS